jgi:hypothetical protein
LIGRRCEGSGSSRSQVVTLSANAAVFEGPDAARLVLRRVVDVRDRVLAPHTANGVDRGADACRDVLRTEAGTQEDLNSCR